MEITEFEKIVGEAVALLPERIRQKLDNVELVVEDGESPGNSLYGLYHGVPHTARGSGYGAVPTLPDKITIYKGTIERFAGGDAQVPPLVRRVVWHEIAHHFGFSESQVRRLERKWEREGKL